MAALALGAALVIPACSNGSDNTTAPPSASSGGSSGGAGAVQATVKDFAIGLTPGTASGGSVTFDITNDGPSTHEFVVFKTDLAEDQLPVSDDGNEVDEEGTGVTHVDEKEDIAANSSATLTVDLDPGSYVIICNLPGHYKLGMHASLTVS